MYILGCPLSGGMLCVFQIPDALRPFPEDWKGFSKFARALNISKRAPFSNCWIRGIHKHRDKWLVNDAEVLRSNSAVPVSSVFQIVTSRFLSNCISLPTVHVHTLSGEISVGLDFYSLESAPSEANFFMMQSFFPKFFLNFNIGKKDSACWKRDVGFWGWMIEQWWVCVPTHPIARSIYSPKQRQNLSTGLVCLPTAPAAVLLSKDQCQINENENFN